MNHTADEGGRGGVIVNIYNVNKARGPRECEGREALIFAHPRKSPKGAMV